MFLDSSTLSAPSNSRYLQTGQKSQKVLEISVNFMRSIKHLEFKALALSRGECRHFLSAY